MVDLHACPTCDASLQCQSPWGYWAHYELQSTPAVGCPASGVSHPELGGRVDEGVGVLGIRIPYCFLLDERDLIVPSIYICVKTLYILRTLG